MKAQNFKQAYAVLQQHAQTLREQQEPNIDDLLHIVTESVSAYKICKERIDAVEQALEKALASADAVGAAPEAPPKRGKRRSPAPDTDSQDESDTDEEGDLPF